MIYPLIYFFVYCVFCQTNMIIARTSVPDDLPVELLLPFSQEGERRNTIWLFEYKFKFRKLFQKRIWKKIAARFGTESKVNHNQVIQIWLMYFSSKEKN